MGKRQGFLKFKRKLRMGAVVRAIIGGLSLGVMVTAAQWLYAKRTLGTVDLIGFAAVAAIPAAVLCIILLAVLLPTDKRLAKRLDKGLAFDERAQTMVAFRRDESSMAALQRADTEERLMNIPRRRLKGVCTWVFVALPLVAALCMVGTILTPAKEPPEEPPVVDSSWYLDAFRQAKLEQLIAEVAESDMEEELRDETVRLLENLLGQLQSIRKESAMKDAVVKTILAIHEAVSEYNTYDLITDAMDNTPSDAIRKLGSSMYTMNPLLINEQLKSIRESLTPAGREASAAYMAEATRQALQLSGTPETYRVHAALAAFADLLDAVTEDTTEAELDEFRAQAEALIGDALAPEMANETVEYNTITALRSIFGIPSTSLPEDFLKKEYDASSEGEYEPDDDPDQNNAGGLGSGEVLFGSNDTIYDPDKGEYVTYGEVLRRYHATVLDHIGSGSIPEELEDMLHDYFAKLSNGGNQKQD